MTSELSVTDLSAGYGDVTVLQSVSFSAAIPGITAVIGSNGAGKTTLLRVLSGLLPAREGCVLLNGTSLTQLKPELVVTQGLALVPEGRRLFAGMSVESNLMMGAFSRLVPLAEIKRDLAYVYDLFPVLADRRRQDAVSMSGGEQQMCAIGRGIMAKPDLLMIDELSLGLAPVAVEILLPALKRLALSGIGLLVVEQDVAVALDLADRAIILDRGRITREGKSGDLIADSAIIEAYLGTDTGEQS